MCCVFGVLVQAASRFGQEIILLTRFIVGNYPKMKNPPPHGYRDRQTPSALVNESA
jgi:hypothetical protein